MATERVVRPRMLSAVFGAYFALMAIIAWYSGQNLGYHYTVDITKFTFMVYLVAGAVFLVGVILATVLIARSLDARIEKLEATAAPDGAVVEEIVVEESADAVPPPLHEVESSGSDHVDRDIDELLVSLQEMEQDAGTVTEVEEVPAPAPPARTSQRAVATRPTANASDATRLSVLRKKRNGLVAYFAGPALASIGVVGISAAMLPGSDGFLQSSFQLNTSVLLGMAYSFVGIAAFVAASVLLTIRTK